MNLYSKNNLKSVEHTHDHKNQKKIVYSHFISVPYILFGVGTNCFLTYRCIHSEAAIRVLTLQI